MQTEIIEPNPLLIEYVKMANSLWTEFDNMNQNTERKEWHYIMSNLEQNIFLLKRLEEKKLLPEGEINICDAGIGLGSALFDIYLQSKDIDNRVFNFFGIEKNKSYLDFLNDNLIKFWSNKLTLINKDITVQDYSKYNIVYSYLPFREEEELYNFYTHVKNDISVGSLIIENGNNGLSINQVLTKVEDLEKIEIDDIFVFRKI